MRFANKSDMKSLMEIYDVYVKKGITRDRILPSESEFEERILKATKTYPCVVCEIEGQVAGYAYVSKHEDNAENRWTTIYVSDSYRRNKIGKALYTCILELIKLQGHQNIHAIVMASNEGSIRFHEAFGFKQVDAFSTAIVMEKKFSDNREASKKIISIKDVDKKAIAKLFKQTEELVKNTFVA